MSLMLSWEKLQREIEEISRSESFPLDPFVTLANDERESALQMKQDKILREIIDLPCESEEEILSKIKFWQRSKRLGNPDLDQFSPADQLVLSIDIDAVSAAR